MLKNQVYGKVTGFIRSVEWQKRGLPHAHILLILEHRDRPVNGTYRFENKRLDHPNSKKNFKKSRPPIANVFYFILAYRIFRYRSPK